jgi:hypothetical protein
MRYGTLLRIFLMFSAVLGASACADSTLPPTDQPSSIGFEQLGPSTDLLLPPVLVSVPHCDPYTDLNNCEEDDGGQCMTATDATASPDEFVTPSTCLPDGGDAGGGTDGGTGGDGSTSPDPTCPESGCTEPEVTLENDMERGTIPPDDCLNPNNTNWQKIYCRSTIDTTQARKTRQALDRIAQRGPECEILAQKGLEMLQAGEIRFFTWTEGDDSGYGHPNSDIQIAAQMVARYDPLLEDQDFEHVLVHELDHVFRRDHIDPPYNWHTPNTALCG